MNHLWFLPYLWLYAVLGALVARFTRLRGELRLPAWAWLLLPAVPLALLRVFVKPRFPIEHDLVHDLYNHLQYGLLFGIGWASRTPLASGLWAAALRLRWVALAVSLLAWSVLVAYSVQYSSVDAPAGLLAAARTLRASSTWWGIVAACGWAQRAFTRDSPWLRQASAAVFCLYILHQSIIVVLSQWLKPLALPFGLEAVLLIVLTLATCAAVYLALRRVPGLALLVGIQRRPRVIGQFTTMPVTSSSTSPLPSAASSASSERNSCGGMPGFQRTSTSRHSGL